EHEYLAAERFPIRGKSHEREIHPIQHQFDRHENRNDVALDQKAGNSAGEQNPAQHQVIGERNHQSSLAGGPVTGRAANTTAPMMAINTSTEVTSNGSRKS